MINEIDVKIEGMDELIKAFSALGEEAYEALKPFATEAAEVVLVKTRSKIKNRTGTLSRSLKIVKPGAKKSKSGVIFAKVTFGKEAAYGVPLELGHRLVFFGKKTLRDVPEKPFMRPAADESKEEVANIITAGMNEILEKWGE